MSLNTSEPMPGWRHPGSPSPKVKRPAVPEHLRALVVESGITGHVVAAFGSMLTVQSDKGRRIHGVSQWDVKLGDRVRFDIVADSEAGSRLQIAKNIVVVRD
jgi:hypothetical protein